MKINSFLIFWLFSFLPLWGFGQNTEIENLVREGIVLHDNGEYGKAIEVYKKALKIDPNSALVTYEMALTYFYQKDYENAEKCSKKVIKRKQDHVLEAYMTYGSVLDLQGKTKKSIKVYEKALQEYDHYLLYYNHAVSCLNLGEVDKAYKSTIQAIHLNSSHASSHLMLSKIMDKKAVRVKAMLPLYFFLLIEPNSQRAEAEYKRLRNYLDHGVTQTSEKNINVLVPMNQDPDFGAAEMMVSLSKASNNLAENMGVTDLQLFTKSNESLFKILGELKKDNSGFWWDFYVTFFYELANEDLTEVYSYYISQSLGEEVVQWFELHQDDLDRFEKWMNEE